MANAGNNRSIAWWHMHTHCAKGLVRKILDDYAPKGNRIETPQGKLYAGDAKAFVTTLDGKAVPEAVAVVDVKKGTWTVKMDNMDPEKDYNIHLEFTSSGGSWRRGKTISVH